MHDENEKFVQQQLKRLNALLGEERAGPGLIAGPVHTPATDVGAIHAVGFQSASPVVLVTVYVFMNAGRRRDAAVSLASRLTSPKVYVRTVTNGPMMLFAHTTTAQAAIDRLDRILSAFAGDE